MASNGPQVYPPGYEALLRDVMSRLRVFNPEWTNLGASDPGVTILELFAYMTAGLVEQANRIPEASRRAFLDLLGAAPRPPVPATGFVCFRNDRTPPAAVTLPPQLSLAAGSTAFETTQGLEVLPLEVRVYYKRGVEVGPGQAEAAAAYAGVSLEAARRARFYLPAALGEGSASLRAVSLQRDTVDQALWLALLAPAPDLREAVRQAVASHVLSLGLLPDGDHQIVVAPDCALRATEDPVLVIEALTAGGTAGALTFTALQAVCAGDPVNEPGLAAVQLPTGLAAAEQVAGGAADDRDLPPALLPTDKDAERVAAWLRLRVDGLAGPGGFSWIGANADLLLQQTTVRGEFVGTGSGEPDQAFGLLNRPVVAGTLVVRVGGEVWQPIDDLLAAGPEVPLRDRMHPPTTSPQAPSAARVYQLDPMAGRITFGDGLHGTRPPKGARISASYAYGGGAAGNVDEGAIAKNNVVQGVNASNPLPTWGGADAQAQAEAEQSVPLLLQHRDRMVTAEDYRTLVGATPGVRMGRVEVLPAFVPSRPAREAPGAVTLVVIPATDPGAGDPPEPDWRFLNTVRRWVEPRRVLGTQVVVTGPQYVRLAVGVGIEARDGASLSGVEIEVARALRRFLSPLTGGTDGRGWPLGRTVTALELQATVDRIPGVAYVRGLVLDGAGGAQQAEIAMGPLELPWLATVRVARGSPPRGLTAGPVPPAPVLRLPPQLAAEVAP